MQGYDLAAMLNDAEPVAFLPTLDRGVANAFHETVLGLPLVDQNELDGDGVWPALGASRIAWFTDPDGNTLSLQQKPLTSARS